MKFSSKHTIMAGYVGYMTQAVTINFPPLLYLTFEKDYGIPIATIGILIAASFLAQLIVDALEAKFASRLDTRKTVVLAHLCSALGLICLSFLPDIIPYPFVGIMISTLLNAVGSGFIEVLISPIVEACPTDNKSAAMSLLHSFYSWGAAGTILLSTIFFALLGIGNWRILAILLSLVPLFGAFLFSRVPIYSLAADTHEQSTAQKKSLWRSGVFWVLFIIMFCSGASELSMSQWASSFAEGALGVSKTVGDLAGPFAFAVLMGFTRVLYAFLGKRMKLTAFFTVSSVLCVAAYLVAALAHLPAISLMGCALCGLAVGIMWPGTYSMATRVLPFGGTRMFALLALAGDIGCTVGPSMSGVVAQAYGNNLQVSFAAASAFPIIITLLLPIVFRAIRRADKKASCTT